jgi:TolA-binding protein
MRFHLLAAVLLAGAAFPAAAQQRPSVEQRVDRIEQQLRAVQRRVFPAGTAQQVEPEIQPQTQQPATRPPSAGAGAVGDLTARVDALEAQLAALTGQIEETAHRTRQMEAAMTRLREETAARLDRIEAAPAQAAVQPVVAPQPAAREPVRTASAQNEPAASPAPAGSGDAAEEAYNAGFRLWEQKRYAEAQTALQAVAERYPRSRWASWAANLAGRAFLDDGKPATAARVFLANYQGNPQGERAADSLFFLGQSLVALNRRPEACRVYDELARVYPNMRDWLRQRLPEARRTARCTAAPAS